MIKAELMEVSCIDDQLEKNLSKFESDVILINYQSNNGTDIIQEHCMKQISMLQCRNINSAFRKHKQLLRDIH